MPLKAQQNADVGVRTRIIVKTKSFAPNFITQNIFKNLGAYSQESLGLPRMFVVEFPGGKLAELLQKLTNNFFIEYVEEDTVVRALNTPNDAMFGSQWGLAKIQAPSGWNINTGSENVTVAILDTGINGSHPDLSGKIATSVNCTRSFCPQDSPTDANGHGTHVAGIAAAVTNNTLGVAGVSWGAKLASVRILNSSGSGYSSWLVRGITWAADNEIDVISMSLGSSFSSSSVRDAIDYAWGKGTILVAAAGNNSSTSPIYPAYYTNVIAVGATDENDNKASFSSYGVWVDVAAPGVAILSTYGSNYASLSGTSMSTPFVSGLAALVLSHNPSWGNSQIRSKIESTSDAVSNTGTYYKYGRINVCKALDCTGSPILPTPTVTPITPTPTNTPTPTPTPTVTPTPTPTSVVTSTPIPTPTPTPSTSKPWWCSIFPTSPSCL